MTHVFDTVLQRLEGKMAWTVFCVPFSVQEEWGTKGRVNVKVNIDGHDFSGTLLPSRNGHYMAFNKRMKDACKKDIGHTIHVSLEKDDAIRTVNLPEDVRKALEVQDAMSKYQALPYYIKREEINRITSAKRSSTRERRIQSFLQKLQQLNYV